MNENSRYAVGIDIGTSKVRVLIADFDKDGSPNILGLGSAENSGIKKGVIMHPENVYRAIDKALAEAERMSGYKTERAAVSINGVQILSTKTDGMVAVSSEKSLVSDSDIDRVEEVALIGKIPENREILKFIPYYYNVDDQEGIADPFEMVGTRLEVYGNAISAPKLQVESIKNIFDGLDIYSNLHLPSVIASSQAVLTDNQKENGVVVVDLGASTTGVAIFEDGNLQFIENISLGGINITNDLAIGLKVSPEVAEEIKIKHGFAFEREEGHDIVVKYGHEHYSFNTQEIDEIIEARVEEIFEEVRRVLKKSGFENQLPSGIVLTGGGAALKGIDTFAKKYLQLAVRIGKNGIENTVSEKVKTLEYSAAVGLLIEMRNMASRYNSYRDEEPMKLRFFARFFKKKR